MGEDLMAKELPPELATLVDAELASGERIAWTGQPSIQTLPAASIPLMMFGVPWTAFAVFWMWAAGGGFRNHPRLPEAPTHWDPMDVVEIVFPLFGLPFVLIGVGLLTSPYWIRRAARRTAYVITDRRAFILNRGRTTNRVRSFQSEVLGRLEHRERADGSGDIVLQQSTGFGKQATAEVAFERIPEVKRVQALLANLPRH